MNSIVVEHTTNNEVNETQVLREFTELIDKYTKDEIKVSHEVLDDSWTIIVDKGDSNFQIFERDSNGDISYIGTMY